LQVHNKDAIEWDEIFSEREDKDMKTSESISGMGSLAKTQVCGASSRSFAWSSLPRFNVMVHIKLIVVTVLSIAATLFYIC
jgi:hypothetical protein